MMKVNRFLLGGLLALLLCAAPLLAQNTVDVYGQVRIYNGTCNTGIGMNGVTVLLYDAAHSVEYTTVTYTDEAFMQTHNLTSPLGIYYFDNVPYRTDYYVEVIPPQGVTLATDSTQGSWWNANPRFVGTNFYRCFLMVLGSAGGTPHTIGYWKHQANVAVTGKGNPQVPPAELQELYNLVFDLFDSAPNFPIAGVSSVNGAPLTAQNALATFNLPNGGSVGMVNKAKKQLLGLVLNVAAEYIASWDMISVDNRTVSEAIAFGADRITNGGAAIGTAKDAMDYINNGNIVPAGWIPAGYGIWYFGNELETTIALQALPETATLLGNYPNPFNPETTIQFVLPAAAQVKLAVYDAAGRQVSALVDGWRSEGLHEVTFDASTLSAGVYFYHLQAGDVNTSGKMVLLK
ncbi:MAG: T9SS type A sorting domain-containing protein [bacterium]